MSNCVRVVFIGFIIFSGWIGWGKEPKNVSSSKKNTVQDMASYRKLRRLLSETRRFRVASFQSGLYVFSERNNSVVGVQSSAVSSPRILDSAAGNISEIFEAERVLDKIEENKNSNLKAE